MGQTFVMAGPGGGAGGMNTAGGPEYAGATMMFFLWQNAFGYFDMGYASATAWVVAILIFLLTWLNFKVSAKWVSYD